MEHQLFLPNRPFQAIKSGQKLIEGRTISSWDPVDYSKVSPGDQIKLTNEQTAEQLTLTLKFIHHYKDVKTMLEAEGAENVLSSEPKTIEHGVASYNQITDYQLNITKFGIYALGLGSKESAKGI